LWMSYENMPKVSSTFWTEMSGISDWSCNHITAFYLWIEPMNFDWIMEMKDDIVVKNFNMLYTWQRSLSLFFLSFCSLVNLGGMTNVASPVRFFFPGL
jgi:hypothetical protein